MPKNAMSTQELAALVDATQKLVCGKVMQAFNMVATRDELDRDRILRLDAAHLRDEFSMKKDDPNRAGLTAQIYQRLLLESILERTEHGLSVLQARGPAEAMQLLGRRAMAMDDGKNAARADRLEKLAAPVLATVFRAGPRRAA